MLSLRFCSFFCIPVFKISSGVECALQLEFPCAVFHNVGSFQDSFSVLSTCGCLSLWAKSLPHCSMLETGMKTYFHGVTPLFYKQDIGLKQCLSSGCYNKVL
jgi:hypothetical protein